MTEPRKCISQAELHELFGDWLPLEAVDILWNASSNTPTDEVRKQVVDLAARKRKCWRCGGAGTLSNGNDEVIYTIDCPQCGGRGYYFEEAK